MDQCLRYDDSGNIYPLPFGPTKTSLYANTPFCVNPVEIVFVILIGKHSFMQGLIYLGLSIMINLASILHVLFEISRKTSKRSSDISEIGFREFNHRRSTLAVIFDSG